MLKQLRPAIWRLLDRFKPMPLHLVLTIPFVLQIVAVVLSIGWLSWQSGQYAIHDLADQLRTEMTTSVAHHLEDYLSLPQKINELNFKTLKLKQLDPNAMDEISELFIQQAQLFNLSYINYGSVTGEFVGVENKRQGTPDVVLVESSTPGILQRYGTNPSGQRTILKDRMPYDFQQESWYADAVKHQHPVWSSVYQWEDQPEVLSISSSYPVYDNDRLLGVLGIDQTISDINDLLHYLKTSKLGNIFLVERSGLLLASSSQYPVYKIKSDAAKQIFAINSRDPLVQSASQFLTNRFGGFQKIHETENLEFKYSGTKQFVQVMPWGKSLGLDWLIVVVAPESNFMEDIHSGFRTTLFSWVLILLLSMWIVSLFARKIAAPIFRLSQASQRIAAGELDQMVEANGITEIKLLTQSFNQMSRQLKASFTRLERINEKLEERVSERTISLRHSEEKFFKAFWCSPVAIAITNTEGVLIEVNASFCQLLGYSPSEITPNNSSSLNIWVESPDQETIIQQLETSNIAIHREYKFRQKSGRVIDVDLSVDRIYLDRQPRLLVVATDITERKFAESALRESEQRFRSVVETIDCVFWVMDPKHQQVMYLSPAFEKIWGYSCEDVYRDPRILATSIHPDDREQMLSVVTAVDPDYDEEYRILRLDGEVRWIHNRAFSIRDEVGTIVSTTGIAEDITEHKKAEQLIQKSLQEKEILLKEIHHRVKNNLHIISSLLDLQSSTIENGHILELFTDTQNRVHAMALVHEQLYQSHDLNQVNFGDYIERLIVNIFCSSSNNLETVHPVIQAEPIYLNLETAIPCGLLLNELVVNALKHAFPGQNIGTISIKLYQDEERKIHLVVADNGVGLPATNDWQNYTSLGLRLVQILTRQLHGSIQVDVHNGTTIHLTFGELDYKLRF